MTDENIDELISNIQLGEKTELEGVAEQIFKADTSRTNLSRQEISLAFTNDIIFEALDMQGLNPTKKFMELKKSHQGWSTEKFVQSVSGVNEQRSGGAMNWFREKFMSRKD